MGCACSPHTHTRTHACRRPNSPTHALPTVTNHRQGAGGAERGGHALDGQRLRGEEAVRAQVQHDIQGALMGFVCWFVIPSFLWGGACVALEVIGLNTYLKRTSIVPKTNPPQDADRFIGINDSFGYPDE